MADTAIIRGAAAVGATIRDINANVLTFDATLKEETRDRVKVSKFAVDEGAFVNDHVIIEPVKLTMSLFVTDSPLTKTARPSQQRLPERGKCLRFWDAMVLMQKQREPVTVTSGVAVYRNMLITGISVQRDSSQRASIAMNVEFQEIQRVSFGMTTVTADAFAHELAALTAESGRRAPRDMEEGEAAPPTEPCPEVAEQTGSFLARATVRADPDMAPAVGYELDNRVFDRRDGPMAQSHAAADQLLDQINAEAAAGGPCAPEATPTGVDVG